MDEDDLRKLEAAGSELSFGAGQMLIESGKPGTGLYVVLEGKIVVEAPEGTRELGPGAVVGERALLSEDGTRSARVRALTFGKVVAVMDVLKKIELVQTATKGMHQNVPVEAVTIKSAKVVAS